MTDEQEDQGEEAGGVGQAVIRYDVTDARIAELREAYSGMTIEGVEDKTGYELVHRARMEVKNLRVAVEKRRKFLKKDALEYGRRVDAAAKEITEKLQPIEDELHAEQKRIDAEKERIREEERLAKKAALDERVKRAGEVELDMVVSEIEKLSDPEFEAALNEARIVFEEKRARAEEQARQTAAERKALDAEREQIRREREELEKLRAQQAPAPAADAEQPEPAAAEAEDFDDPDFHVKDAGEAPSDSELVFAYADALFSVPLPKLRDAELGLAVEGKLNELVGAIRALVDPFA